MKALELMTRAMLTNVNVRRELHGDQNQLAVDLDFSADIPVSKLVGIKGTDFDVEAYQRLMWKREGQAANTEPVPVTFTNSDMKFAGGATKEQIVEISEPLGDETQVNSLFRTTTAKVREVKITSLKPSFVVTLKFQVQCEASGDTVKVLSEAYVDGHVHLKIEPAPQELDMDDDEAA